MQAHHPRSLARVALIGAIIAGYILALVLEASPLLHKRLHHDADDAQHGCLVTTINHSGCDGAGAEGYAVLVSPAFSHFLINPTAFAAGSFFLSCSIFERGPPVVSLS